MGACLPSDGEGSAKTNFDIHCALGLWTWIALFIITFTRFSLNLYREAFFPMMSMVSKVTPAPLETRTPTDELHPIEARFN